MKNHPNHIGIKAWKRLTQDQKKRIIGDRPNARLIFGKMQQRNKSQVTQKSTTNHNQPQPTITKQTTSSEL